VITDAKGATGGPTTIVAIVCSYTVVYKHKTVGPMSVQHKVASC